MKSRSESPTLPLPPAPSAPRAGSPVYLSQRLFQGANLVWIDHEGELYTLRRTRQGKLILTK